MFLRLAATAAILLLAAGCGDDTDRNTPPALYGGIQGVFTDAETAEPLAGVEVFLIPSIGEQPVTAAVLTDTEGAYRFNGLEAGWYGLFVHDQHRFLERLERNRQLIEVRAGETAAGDLSFWVTLPTSGSWRIEGRVLDRRTHEAVPRAFVAGLFAPSGDAEILLGIDSSPGIDVTDEDGRFNVRVGTVEREPGVPIGLDPITAMAVDYRPATIGEGEPAHLPLPASGNTLAVTLPLAHVADAPSSPRGIVTGHVTFLGAPVPDLQMGVGVEGLELITAPGTLAASVPLADAVPTTDGEGNFLMGFPAGLYVFHPGVYAGATHAADPFTVAVIADTTVGPIQVEAWRIVTPVSPLPGQADVDSVPTFVWRRMPVPSTWDEGAWRVAYAVDRSRWTEITCGPDTTCVLPESSSLPAGARVRWRATYWAVPPGAAEPRKLADFAGPAWFVVDQRD